MPEERITEKLPYVTPEMDITIFSGEDVIATSGIGADGYPDNWDSMQNHEQHTWWEQHYKKENIHSCPIP